MKRAICAVSLLMLALLSLVRLTAEERESLMVRSRAALELPQDMPGELIVGFVESASQPAIENALRDVGGVYARKSQFGGRYMVQLEAGLDEATALARLSTMPGVAYAERNGTARTFLRPNDRYYGDQWNLRMVDAERTWDIQQGDPSVVVAVIDTGVAYEDFGPYRKAPDWGSTVFVSGFNALTRDSHANDDEAHGTHVASTVAEAANNALGVAGFCFNCGVMPVKVLNSRGVGSFFNIAEGVDYAVSFRLNGRNPVKVINLSLGGDADSQTMRAAIDRAVAAGIVVVAAAGNDGRNGVSFPASLSNVIAVGAVNPLKQRSSFSNYGSALDVVAPGGDDNGFTLTDLDRDGVPDGILQQTFSNRSAQLGRYDDFAYYYYVGTSQATPHVAALAAMLVRQGITDPVAVQRAIESTAEDLGSAGRDDQFGHGLIRPVEALKGLGLGK